MIDINNLVTYEKYRKQLMANAELKQIVEFAKIRLHSGLV